MTALMLMRAPLSEINRAIRELDRERMNLQNQEKKLIIEIKKMAKEGQIASVKIMAKDLVRTRQHVTKFYTMRSQLQAVSLRMETARSTAAIVSALHAAVQALKAMAKTMSVGRLTKVTTEYRRESENVERLEQLLDDRFHGSSLSPHEQTAEVFWEALPVWEAVPVARSDDDKTSS